MLLSNQFLFWDQAISVIGSKMASYVLGLIYNVDFLDDAQVLFNFFLFEKKKNQNSVSWKNPRGATFNHVSQICLSLKNKNLLISYNL